MAKLRTVSFALVGLALLTAQGQPGGSPNGVAPGTVSRVVDPGLLTHVDMGLHVHGIAKDPSTGDLYVGDWNFRRSWAPFVGVSYIVDDSIRRITPSGEVKRIADISRPNGVVLNPKDGMLYITTGGGDCRTPAGLGSFKTSCPGRHGIVVLNPATGEHHDLVGLDAGEVDGDFTSARFTEPADLAVDPDTGVIYVAEPRNHRIRSVALSGVVATLAGSGTQGAADGTGSAASFNYTQGITYCAQDKALYVADTDNNEVRKVTMQGAVTTIAGSTEAGYNDGPAANARFNHPSGIVCDSAGDLYIADTNNNMIREIDRTGMVSTIAGTTDPGTVDGVGSAARFSHPGDITLDAVTGALYVVDFDSNDIRKVTTASQATAAQP